MAQLKDVIAYLLREYPHKQELSNARVTKMVYLADWKHAITAGHQMSDIRWYFNHFGPFVPDVLATAREYDNLFRVESTWNAFGSRKELLQLANDRYQPRLSPEEQQTLRFVIEKTAPLSFDAFIRLVYSTYPIMKMDRYSELNLVSLAKEYERAP